MKGFALLSALFLVLSAAVIMWTVFRTERWTFKESDRRIANPDRGFYIQVKSSRPDKIPEIAGEVRVILLSFDIEDFADEELPAEKLGELRTALETAGREHVAVVFRAAYGFSREVREPGRIEWMGRHIGQIAEVLNAYPDRILVVQAGMLGAYGEWHSSRYLEGTEEERRKSRLYILRQWENCLRPEIQTAVRRPRFVREAMEAGILSGRIGLHNDALLSTDSDMGTYDDSDRGRADELLWSQEYLAGQVNGGEMPTPGERSAPENADREFAQLHLGYLNLKYNEEIIDGWSGTAMKGTDAKSYLENHLGYRLFLSELKARRYWSAGEMSAENGGIQMRLCLCNTGYAALPDKYRVFVEIGDGGGKILREIEIPELYGISNGQSVEKDLKIGIPAELLQKEKIRIGLKIAPRADETDGRDCVELANDGFVYQEGVNGMLFLERRKNFGFRLKLQERSGPQRPAGAPRIWHRRY